APVTERWPYLDVRESRFTQHLRYLLPGILFALCPSEHDHAERRDGEGSRLVIVIEHLMNENVASRPQTLEALPSKEATFLRCPVMIDHRIEVDVGRWKGIRPHVSRVRPDARLQVVTSDEL